MCETTSQDAFIAGSVCHTVLRKTWVKYQVRQATKYSFLFQGLSLTCSSEGTRRKLFSLLGLLSWGRKSLISRSRHSKCSLLTFPDLHISALPWLGGVPQSSVQLGAEGGSLGQDPLSSQYSRLRCPPHSGSQTEPRGSVLSTLGGWSQPGQGWSDLAGKAQSPAQPCWESWGCHLAGGEGWLLNPHVWNRGAGASCSEVKTCVPSNSRISEVFEIQIRSLVA